MERARSVFRLLLLSLITVLALSGTALAADGYSVRGVDVNREDGTAAVSLTAAGDCTLYAAVYDEAGNMLDVGMADVTGGEGTQKKTISFPGGIQEGTSVSAFLLDDTLAPLCRKGTGTDRIVYAILYDDGTMVFQNGDTPESGRTVTEMWQLDLNGYRCEDDYAYTPWNVDGQDANIKHIVIADKIQMLSLQGLFSGLRNLEDIQNLSNLDTSNVTDMSYLFYGCNSLANLDLSGFKTDQVTDMSYMFFFCYSLAELDLSGFRTANVTDMSYMFTGTTDVNRYIVAEDRAWENGGEFDTSQIKGLRSLDLSSFDTRSVRNMNRMFWADCLLETIYVSENFIVHPNCNASYIFENCDQLVGEKGTKWDKWEDTKHDGRYARIDNPPDEPGYFTYKAAPTA